MKDKDKKSVKTTYNKAILLTFEVKKTLLDWNANGIELLNKIL